VSGGFVGYADFLLPAPAYHFGHFTSWHGHCCVLAVDVDLFDKIASFVLTLNHSYTQKEATMTATIATVRSARLGLRATPAQETVLRRAAEVAHKSLTDFILDAAYMAAEQTLLDQRLFMVSGSQYQALLEMLDRPESDNPGLADLFSRRPVWSEK
jgi:uncharacterized protein (DUF1778 family)